MTSYLHIMGHGGKSISLQRVTSLRRRARVNTPAVLYWLDRVFDDSKLGESILQEVPGAESAMHYCLVVFDETFFENSLAYYSRHFIDMSYISAAQSTDSNSRLATSGSSSSSSSVINIRTTTMMLRQLIGLRLLTVSPSSN